MHRQSATQATQPGRPEPEDVEDEEWVEVRETWWIYGRKFRIIAGNTQIKRLSQEPQSECINK